MRGRRLITLKPKSSIPHISSDIFEFEINCQQHIYLSEKIEVENGFIMSNMNLPDSYWNYAVITDDTDISEVNNIFRSTGLKTSVYLPPGIRKISRGIKEYEDAWMVLNTYNGSTNNDVKVDLLNDKKEFIQTYKFGRESKDINSPYEFSDYDLFLVNRQFEYAGDMEIRHYAAYIAGEIVGVATLITKGKITSICDVTTLQNFRNKGVGQALMSRLVADTPSKNTLYLVTERGAYTEKWYRKQGFETVFYGLCLSGLEL